MLVVSAHSADFVWRAAGAIATRRRGRRYGARRRALLRRARRVGRALEGGRADRGAGQGDPPRRGARPPQPRSAPDFRSLDLGDYPLVMDAAAVERLTDLIRELEPQRDPHPCRARPVQPRPRRRPRGDRAGAPARERRRRRERVQDDRAARAAALRAAPARALRLRARRRSSTSRPCGSKKVAAMEAMGAQGYLRQYYSERAEHRANHARRISGRTRHPLRRGVPARDPRRRRRAVTDYAALARLGVATVHEAAGRIGIVDLPLTQVVPGSRVAGPARIALCAPGDNTMVHAAVAHAEPGRRARADERRAGAGRARRRAARDAGAGAGRRGDPRRRRRRDLDELAAIGLPIWARFVRAQGATKGEVGKLDVPVVVGGAEIRPGDLVVHGLRRGDGAPERACRRGAAARARAGRAGARDAASATRRASSPTTCNGLREIVEG